MVDYTTIKDVEGRSLLRRQADLAARFILIDLTELTYAWGEHEASAILFHAEMYLADRLSYMLNPPPEGMIPVVQA